MTPPTANGRRSLLLFTSRRRLAILATALVVVGCAGAGAVAFGSVPPRVRVLGLENGAVLNKAEAKDGRLTLVAKGGTQLDALTVQLDGKAMETRASGDRLLVEAPELADGAHELTVTSDGDLGFTETTRRRFTVDTKAPELRIEKAKAESLRAPATIRGRVEGAEEVTVGGAKVTVADDGSFSHELAEPVSRVRVAATDAGGNAASENATVIVEYPDTRAVHVTAIGWTSDALREPILKMAEQGKINAVQLDIKDENGEIGYDSQVPLAQKIGASKGHYDARKVIRELHERDVRVIGRIVAFRDPILAGASWRAGEKQRVVQNAQGAPYDGGGHYGNLSFTNFADPEVREYNMDLAVEAAKLGFDDILYDYVRRPDGKLSGFRFPGLDDRRPTEMIASFMGETRERIRPEGAFLGACVYGIAATRPTEIAQDIPAMAQHADYIAPMVYPSHWGPGEYGVARPNSSPYKIVKRSLADFVEQVEGTGAKVVPWLQDFSLGVPYGDHEVAAQIKAAQDDGIDSFILWNASARYHAGALTPRT